MSTRTYSVRDQHGDELASFDNYGHAVAYLRQWGGTGDVLDTVENEVVAWSADQDDYTQWHPCEVELADDDA